MHGITVDLRVKEYSLSIHLCLVFDVPYPVDNCLKFCTLSDFSDAVGSKITI